NADGPDAGSRAIEERLAGTRREIARGDVASLHLQKYKWSYFRGTRIGRTAALCTAVGVESMHQESATIFHSPSSRLATIRYFPVSSCCSPAAMGTSIPLPPVMHAISPTI